MYYNITFCIFAYHTNMREMKNRVRSICQRQNRSLTDVAEKMGIARENLNKILGEKGNPTLETLQKLATALDVEVWELFTDTMPTRSLGDVHGVIYIGGKPTLLNSMADLENLLNLSKMGQS